MKSHRNDQPEDRPENRIEDCSAALAVIPTIDQDIDLFLATVGFGFNPRDMHRVIRSDALRLSAKSDAELACLGIRRREIPAYVLRHRLPGHAPVLVR